MTGHPRAFTMEIQHIGARLVFDATGSDETGEYSVYSIDPADYGRFMRGEWDAMKKSLEPTGQVPVSDVEIDDAGHAIRIRTYGLERFARYAPPGG